MDPNRRQFLKDLAGKSALAAGVTVAAASVAGRDRLRKGLHYAKPMVKSFSPTATLYAQTTGAGKFTLKGTT